MGVETALIAATVVSATASVASGIAQQSAANREAKALNAMASTAQDEATAEAQRRATDVRQFQRKQKLAFLKNGVTLEGSPLLILDETLQLGQEEVDAIMKRGTAEAKYYRESAAIKKNQGRAALIGGIGGAASSVISGYGIGKAAGMFNTAPAPSDFSSRFARDTMLSRS